MKYIPYTSDSDAVHERLFGHRFGEHGKFKVGLGSPFQTTSNPIDVQGHFITPAHVEYEVGYNACDSYILNGGRVFIISDHPDAELGDEGNIAEQVMENGMPYPRVSMFVTLTGRTDPRPPVDFVTGEPLPRDTGLKMATKYYWRIYRTDKLVSGEYPPLTLEANGED